MLAAALLLVGVPLAAGGPEGVWILLADKPDGRGGRLDWRDGGASRSGEQLGLPLAPEYLDLIEAAGVALRFRSRWLNAVSARATAAQQEWLKGQPFVLGIQPVKAFRRPAAGCGERAGRPSAKAALAPDHGVAFEQLAQIRVIELHALGYDGQGVRIALLDNGYHYVEHQAFRHLKVVAERDFINDDGVVADEPNQPVTGDETRSTQNIHGAQVLSVLAGYDPGRFIGVAPRAEYLLAKTEDNDTEMPIEEDRWIAGLEWADSLGAQVVNSSLGYNRWDDGTGYTYEQMDGATALTTRAAEAAVRRGIVVVAAAGNEGDGEWRYVTAPADGPGVISVGSVDIPPPGGRPPLLAASSSRGPTADGRLKPDVVTPGLGVVVADIRGGDYLRTSGTSFAAPLVSGVCALLLQIHPHWTPAQVQEVLQRTAMDLGEAGPDTAYGWGQVDALRASGLQPQLPGAALAGHPFPNPATSERVYFPVQATGREMAKLRIFDLAGALVYARDWMLVAGDYTSPERALVWEIDERTANGLFFYRLRLSSEVRTGKIALARQPLVGITR